MSMFKILSIFVSICFLSLSQNVKANPSFENSKTVLMDSDEGVKRFNRAEAKINFFKLANVFEPQSNRLFCGPTSASIVLNAMFLRKNTNHQPILPKDTNGINETELKIIKENFDEGYDPFFNKFTQQTVFKNSVKSREEVFGKLSRIKDLKNNQGVSIYELNAMLQQFYLKTDLYIGDEIVNETDAFKSIIHYLEKIDHFVIVNFNRTSLGQIGTGHFSPLGAYDKTSDSFLVMDVNPTFYKWFWVKKSDLFEAMKDQKRGFILIKNS